MKDSKEETAPQNATRRRDSGRIQTSSDAMDPSEQCLWFFCWCVGEEIFACDFLGRRLDFLCPHFPERHCKSGRLWSSILYPMEMSSLTDCNLQAVLVTEGGNGKLSGGSKRPPHECAGQRRFLGQPLQPNGILAEK